MCMCDAFLVNQNQIVVGVTPTPRNRFRTNSFSIGSRDHVNLIKGFPNRGGEINTGRQKQSTSQKLNMVPEAITSFNGSNFQQSSLIFVGTNALGFIISLVTGSHIHLDLLGTGAFAAAALPSLLSSTCTRISLSSAAVFTWGAKLASFLFFRALKIKHDGRLDDTLSTTSGTCE